MNSLEFAVRELYLKSCVPLHTYIRRTQLLVDGHSGLSVTNNHVKAEFPWSHGCIELRFCKILMRIDQFKKLFTSKSYLLLLKTIISSASHWSNHIILRSDLYLGYSSAIDTLVQFLVVVSASTGVATVWIAVIYITKREVSAISDAHS